MRTNRVGIKSIVAPRCSTGIHQLGWSIDSVCGWAHTRTGISGEMEPTGIEPVTSCLQSRRGHTGASRYGGLASVTMALLLAKLASVVLKAVLAVWWYSGGTLRIRWHLTANKTVVIQ